ncbi:MAG: hypothetical protein FWG02_01345, partial [Holophagaceae bacterium]|nr:hypothetical protein [Holophagaceae bacterium]
DLNKAEDNRRPPNPYLESNPRLSAKIDGSHFRYINGSLFERNLDPATFNRRMRDELLDCLNFDWGQISPAVFGSMFQGVMDKDQRREIGAHYTSEENILKLINPLFMDELRKEFDSIKKQAKTKKSKALATFQNKLASLKFLDPACGCGNFLIVAYRELRRLELEVVKTMLGDKHGYLHGTGITGNLKVNVDQFYGIEIEEWPCQIARTGMWLMDHLMNLEATEIFERYEYRLPLKQGATIVYANAHRIDWEELVPKSELSYILGNPPFIGYSYQSQEQKEDVLLTCLDEKGKPIKNVGKIDYVVAWYYKASQYIQGTQIRVAFVSTNSITQGEQVATVWKPLFDMFGIHIDFAYRTFKWSNEAKGKAAVHCVIIGFSTVEGIEKVIYDDVSAKASAMNINPYLVDALNVFIENRKKPICAVPEMMAGGKPTEGGNLIMSKKERNALVKVEPNAKKYVRRYYMGDDFINDIERYCLWLVNCPPNELKQMPLVLERVERVRQMRLNSKKLATQAKAKTPMLFDEIRKITGKHYVVVPKVSSERRQYVPIGFLSADNIPGDKLFVVCNMGLYGFGILVSAVHMAWMRAVCGRLGIGYSYSNTIVYNNFPWPNVTDKQKADIEKLAQDILDARALFPKSSFADLYDPLTMPRELLRAHQALDRAVVKLYGFAKGITEPEIVAELMTRYQRLVAKQ